MKCVCFIASRGGRCRFANDVQQKAKQAGLCFIGITTTLPIKIGMDTSLLLCSYFFLKRAQEQQQPFEQRLFTPPLRPVKTEVDSIHSSSNSVFDDSIHSSSNSIFPRTRSLL